MTRLSVFKILSFGRSALVVLAVLVIAGCQSDVVNRNDVDPVSANPDQGTPVATNPGAEPDVPVVPPEASEDGSDSEVVNNGQFSIGLSATQFRLEEGLTTANLDINIIRENGHNLPITLALGGDSTDLRFRFSDLTIDTNENTSNLQIELGVARAPIQSHQRVITLAANDGNGSSLESTITLNIEPTSAPDVYLLIGQSNMVGASLFDARESDVGEADAPNGRIQQLNVTGNDSTNFPTEAAFTDPNNFVNQDAPTVIALDPLHDGFNFSIDGKSNTQIGMGLTFAKSMLPSTTANIMLVPAAWSDTGFCQTDTIHLPGIGWNATAQTDTENFAGTLLHDRALARLNFTLEQSGGVFRGILWHQGEADSSMLRDCAQQYQDNLFNLVASIRSNASVDLRGGQARGAAADVPFIAGTLSVGDGFEIPWTERQIVMDAHTAIPSRIPFAALVDNSDLIPANGYPCGDGGCIHFGALAYREMGRRYAERMQAVQRQ